MSELKHVGRYIPTGKKCVVVFRTLPGDAYTCLIAPTENLPDSYHDALINLVSSSGGQQAYEFGEVMARANFPDGSIMLAALHAQKRLASVPTNQVEMLPNANTKINLAELNQIIAEQRGVPVDELAIKDPKKSDDAPQTVAEVKEMPAEIVKESANVNVTPEQQAKEYRSKADKLAKEAAQFRRLAEELSPTKKKTATV